MITSLEELVTNARNSKIFYTWLNEQHMIYPSFELQKPYEEFLRYQFEPAGYERVLVGDDCLARIYSRVDGYNLTFTIPEWAREIEDYASNAVRNTDKDPTYNSCLKFFQEHGSDLPHK